MNTPSELFDFYGAYMNMYEAADKTQPKPTVLPRSRETNIGDQTTKGWKDRSMAELDDWEEKQTERPTNREAQKKRLEQAIGTQRRQDKESGLRNSFEYVLDYLIDEGYTDSYEGAIEIVECMSDEWLEQIVEGFVPLDDRKRALVTGFINSGIDKLKGNVSKIELAQKELANNQKPTHRIGSLVKDTKTTSKLVGNAQKARERTTQDRIAITRKKLDLVTPRNNISRFQRNDVEYVLDYLIDEGFTDSYESALVIVEAMSDEWFEDLIDERTRFAKETGKSATSGRTSERGGLMNQSGDVRKAALLHVMKNPPSGAGVRMGASGQPIPGGGSGSRQKKKERGAKVKQTPRTYVTSTQKEKMRKRAEGNIGSRFD